MGAHHLTVPTIPTESKMRRAIKEEQRRQLEEKAEMMAQRSVHRRPKTRRPVPEEHMKQLRVMAESMMTKRQVKEPVDGSTQRVKLKLVAKRMNSGSSNESKAKKSSSDEPKSRRTELPRRKSSRQSQSTPRGLSLAASLESLPLYERSPVDLDESSVSTYTTLENSLNNSYNGSLEVSSRSLLNSSLSTSGSGLSRGLSASEDGLDCSYFLIISNIWETVKRMEGYQEDLAEHLICQMMIHADASHDVRGDLKLKSFRSRHFKSLASVLVDAIDVLVTLIGPDLDPEELLEIGEQLMSRGVSCKLFGQAMAPALRDLIGEKDFPKDDFDAWQTAFALVSRKMEG